MRCHDDMSLTDVSPNVSSWTMLPLDGMSYDRIVPCILHSLLSRQLTSFMDYETAAPLRPCMMNARPL
jgi:hypothetical protein